MPTVVTRYINTASSAGGDGTTNGTAGANRAWATLDEARAAINTAYSSDLVAADVQIELEASSTTGDTTAVTDTWPTSDATRYIHLKVPTADQKVIYDANVYTYARNVNFAPALSITTNSIRFTGIQVFQTGFLNVGGNGGIYVTTSTDGVVVFDGVKVGKLNNVGEVALYVQGGDDTGITAVARNCLTGLDIGGSSFAFTYGIAFQFLDDDSLAVGYNNTIAGGTDALLVTFTAGATNAVSRLKNNLMQSVTNGITVTNETTDDQATNHHSSGTDASFVSAGAGDFSLTNSDTVARNQGTDLSGVSDWPFDWDADLSTRPISVAWDIGAHENTDPEVTASPGVGALVLTGFAPSVDSGPQVVTPGTGQLILTGFTPFLDVVPQILAYRLVIPGIGSVFVPGDPDTLPDTDFYITSKRAVDHPWIAQAGDGPNAGPDLSVGGQELQMPLGRTVDGEVQIRVIDVAAPIAGVACDVNSSLVDEGYAGLDASTYNPPGDWTIVPTPGGTGPQNWWAQGIGEPYVSGFALFSWFPPDGGAWVRESWITRGFDGTESGGTAFVDGQKVGLRVRTRWTLNTGPSAIFIEANGVRVMGLSPLFDFWDIPVDPGNNQVDSVVWTTAAGFPASVTVKLGGQWAPSCNVFCEFSDLQFVSCDDTITGVDEERYVTSWLADSDARQQLLGRKAYLEESLDGGTTWTRVLYSGYLRQAELGASLTYLLTLGDAGRGRRNSKAWSGLTPEVTP